MTFSLHRTARAWIASVAIACGLFSVTSEAATGTIMPTPFQVFLDTNGNPISGGKICTYTAGTTTPVATYTDSALSVANGNPIVTDLAGRFTAYLSPGVSYKFIYQNNDGTANTCNGTVIKTVDNVSAVPASSSNLDITGTAGEALPAGVAVYLSDGSGSKTAGQWFKADAANPYSSTVPATGIAPAAIASGSAGTIRLIGSVTGLSSLTIGTAYYVGTAGALTATAPTLSRALGVADTTSSLVLKDRPAPTQAWVDDFRLSPSTATCIPAADVTAATTLYLTPCFGNRLDLPDSTGNPIRVTTAELSIAVPATTATVYDVYAYLNGSTPTLELLAWTSGTARATNIVRTNGRYLKTGDSTRLYLGSIRTTAVSGQIESSTSKRFVWNYYNRVALDLLKIDGTASWPYTTATWRQANGAATNQVETLVGVAEVALDLTATVATSNDLTGGGMNGAIGIGQGSTTTPMANAIGGGVHYLTANQKYSVSVRVRTRPAIGYQFWAWLEDSQALGVTTWYGDAGALVVDNAGLQGFIEG